VKAILEDPQKFAMMIVTFSLVLAAFLVR